MAIFAPYIAPYDPTKRVGGLLESPNSRFIMGTDSLGRDVFSRIIYGSRIVLRVTFLSIIISLLCGVPLGLIAGYVGGELDSILSLIMDAMYAFPGLVLAIAALSFLGLGPVTAPTPDWGMDLRMGHAYLAAKIWWPSTFPGLMIVLLTLGFSLLGEGISDILNPRLRR